MCGILYTNYKNLPKNKFIDALNLLNHRGPDAQGFASLKDHKFGHKRLKIIDLDNRSNQPMYSQCGNYLVIFNGEIYNFKELAKKYLKNIKLKTTSDTEILLELFTIYGSESLDLLDGMFAFVIYDIKKDSIFAARDRMGVKPLYIHQNSKGLIISSELAPIISLIDTVQYDSEGIRQYLKMRSFFNQCTIYKNIKIFEPGSYFKNNKKYKYWDLPRGTKELPSDQELVYLIEQSIKEREQADVSIGSYLSGGLDSSLISAKANINDTWTVGFKENNEFKWSTMVAKKIQTNHHEVRITENEFLLTARDIIQKTKRPLSVPNEVLLYKMTKEVKTLNTVVLSGEGADELFFGYDRIFSWANSSKNFDISKFDKLYSYGSHKDFEIIESIIEPYLESGETIDIISRFFQIGHLEGLLLRLDSSTMLNSVEARVPFVDNRKLIERMAGVNFNGRFKKQQLKRISKNILPPSIIRRKKIGFPVNLSKIKFNNKVKNNQYDNWLSFNLNTLIGEDFDIREYVQ